MVEQNKNSVINRKRGKSKIQSEFTDKQKVKGVMFFLYDKGYTDAKQAHLIIRHYCIVKKIITPEQSPIVFACVEIQKDFSSFLNFTNEFYNRKQSNGKD